jgi:predicted DNA-binding transcriptional regulator AlpA
LEQPPIALRLDDAAKALGISRRQLERERAAGRFPKPDRVIGTRTPIWHRQTIERWVNGAA